MKDTLKLKLDQRGIWVALAIGLIAVASLELYTVFQWSSDKFSRVYSGKADRAEAPGFGLEVTSRPPESSIENSDVSLLDELPLWTPEIHWMDVQARTWQYYESDSRGRFIGYKAVHGFSRSAAVGGIGLPRYFDDIDERLKLMAWHENPYLAGSGPDGTFWGYEKAQNGKRRIFVLWSRLRSCPGADGGPCYEETAFYSDSF